MYDLIDSIVSQFIMCVPALIGIRWIFDFTRQILFKD